MLLPGVADPGCPKSGLWTTGAGAETTDRPGGPLLGATLGRSEKIFFKMNINDKKKHFFQMECLLQTWNVKIILNWLENEEKNYQLTWLEKVILTQTLFLLNLK